MDDKENEKKDGNGKDNVGKSSSGDERRLNAQMSYIDEYRDNPYNNTFIDSLEHVTKEELGKPPEKKPFDLVDFLINGARQLIFYAAIIAFFVAGYQLVYKLYAYQQADDIYSSLAESVFSGFSDDGESAVATMEKSKKSSAMSAINTGSQQEAEADTEEEDDSDYDEVVETMKVQLIALQRQAPAVIAWIRIEGSTEVNYPVVQAEDNDHYLHYAYDETYNPAGAIFLDYHNNTSIGNNRHTIIYGHNMESGSPMFANLLKYQSESFWEKNKYIDIYTPEGLFTYEVFAAYESSPSQVDDPNHPWRLSFNKDDTVFMEWIDYIRSRSDISPDVEVNAKSRILTLSTCTNLNDMRYVVHAVLVDSKED